jgi:hypothetical protein
MRTAGRICYWIENVKPLEYIIVKHHYNYDENFIPL